MVWSKFRELLSNDSEEFTHSFEARIEPAENVNLDYDGVKKELVETVEAVADEQYDIESEDINSTETMIEPEKDNNDKELELAVSDIFEVNAKYMSQERYITEGSIEVKSQYGGETPLFKENMKVEIQANNFEPIDIIAEELRDTEYSIKGIEYEPKFNQ
jgi:hypothetical protein